MADLITVKAAKDDRRIVLAERHPDHPKGRAFIAGNGKTHKVARTMLVARHLAGGALVEVKGQAKPVTMYDGDVVGVKNDTETLYTPNVVTEVTPVDSTRRKRSS
jgi:hypothetical protein